MSGFNLPQVNVSDHRMQLFYQSDVILYEQGQAKRARRVLRYVRHAAHGLPQVSDDNPTLIARAVLDLDCHFDASYLTVYAHVFLAGHWRTCLGLLMRKLRIVRESEDQSCLKLGLTTNACCGQVGHELRLTRRGAHQTSIGSSTLREAPRLMQAEDLSSPSELRLLYQEAS